MVVDGRAFVWTAEIRHAPGSADCHRSIRVRVWGGGKTSRALEADLLSKTWPAPWGACATDGAYPEPAEVRALIRYALAHGWLSEALGGTFVLTEAGHAQAFELPQFLLTDRLRSDLAADPTARVRLAYDLRATPQLGNLPPATGSA